MTNVRVTYDYPPATVEAGLYPATVVDEFKMDDPAACVNYDLAPFVRKSYERAMCADRITVEFDGRKVTIKDRERTTPYES